MRPSSTASPTIMENRTRTSSALVSARACPLIADAVVDHQACQENTTEVGGGVLVVAGGDSAPLFEPAEAALNGVAVLVDLAVERGRPPTRRSLGLAAFDLIATFGDRVGDLLGPQVRSGAGMGIRLVRQQPERLGVPRAVRRQQRLQIRVVAGLAG